MRLVGSSFEDAEDSFLQAASLAERLGARLLLAAAEEALGEAYVAAGRRGDARDRLRRASEHYCWMGLSTRQQEADNLLAKLT